MITITLDKGSLEQARKTLQHIPKGAEKAVSRAINRTATGMRMEIVRQVRGHYHIASGEVKQTLKIQKSSYKKLRAQVSSRGKPRSLVRFKVSPKNPQSTRGRKIVDRSKVRLSVSKGKRATLKKAFVMNAKSGLGLFQRKGRGKKSSIKKLYGPSVPQMLHTRSVLETIQREGQERFARELNHQMAWLLKGGK